MSHLPASGATWACRTILSERQQGYREKPAMHGKRCSSRLRCQIISRPELKPSKRDSMLSEKPASLPTCARGFGQQTCMQTQLHCNTQLVQWFAAAAGSFLLGFASVCLSSRACFALNKFRSSCVRGKGFCVFNKPSFQPVRVTFRRQLRFCFQEQPRAVTNGGSGGCSSL